jgi:hypothetical protein
MCTKKGSNEIKIKRGGGVEGCVCRKGGWGETLSLTHTRIPKASRYAR